MGNKVAIITQSYKNDEYCHAAQKLLGLKESYDKISYFNYMNTPVCFVRENVQSLLQEIKKHSKVHSWKNALCNTYRFGEYYMYGIYTDHELKMKNHFLIDYHVFPQIDISECLGVEDFKSRMTNLLDDEKSEGLWLQKKDRKLLADKYLDFDTIEQAIKEYWNKK